MSGRIVITGAGVVSSVGVGQDEFRAALNEGRSGIDVSGTATRPAAAVRDFNPQNWLGPRGWRGLDRSARLLCVSSFLALRASEYPEQPGNTGYLDVGSVCGTMFGSLQTILSFHRSAVQDNPNLVRPVEFANAEINSCTDQTAIRLRLRSINSTLSAGLASGLLAIGHGADCIRLGRTRAVLAGGVEALCEELCNGFADLGMMSPSGRIRPFASGRDGTVLGEGSAVLMLETEAGALSRGLHPRVEICGFGSSSYAPEMPGDAQSAIGLALASANLSPEDISCVITSGNGSPEHDRGEASALASIFGPRLGETPTCAPKAAFGECLGASGALLALSAVIALQESCLPPTPGAHENEYGLRLSAHRQPLHGDYALVHAFGCGIHAALVLRAI